MKYYVILFMFLVTAWPLSGQAEDHVFNANTAEGVSVMYKVISETDKTVQVGNGEAMTAAISQTTSGKITIPETAGGYQVVAIGPNAFFNCSELTEVVLPSTLRTIGVTAFQSCTSLKKIDIPASVTEIGAAAFVYCSKLQRITIPEGVTKIWNNTFSYCLSLESLTLPSTITEIDQEALVGCSRLGGLFLKSSIPAALHEKAVSDYMYPTTTVYVPSGSESTYAAADGWKNFSQIRKPMSSGDVFTWTDRIGVTFTFKVLSADGQTIQLGSGSGAAISTSHSGNLNMPTNACGYEVTAIAANAFQGCTGITAVTANYYTPMSFSSSAFPSSVYSNGYLYIDESLRSLYASTGGWSSFTKVNPAQYSNTETFTAKTVEGIDMKFTVTDNNKKTVRVAWGGYNPEDEVSIDKETSGPVTIPDYINGYKVTAIGNYAFMYCKKITSVRIPDAVEEIGKSAFYYCTSLASFNIPKSLKTLGEGAFGDCFELSGDVIIPSGMTTLEKEVFLGCRKLGSVTLPNTVKTIAKYAFRDNRGLVEMKLPSSVTTLGEGAFSHCPSLQRVVIPANMTNLGDGVFAECEALTELSVASGNPVYDSRGNSNAIIRSSDHTLIQGTVGTRIPSSVKAIGPKAFQGLTALKEISIPSGVTSIGEYAYDGCTGVTGTVVIPASVTTVGNNAFKRIKPARVVVEGNVQTYDFGFEPAPEVVLYVTTPPDYYLGGSYPSTLYVPKGSLSAYQNHNIWKWFDSIKEIYPLSTTSFTVNSTEGVSVTYNITDHGRFLLQVGNGTAAAIATGTSGALTIPAGDGTYTATTIAAGAFKNCSKLTEVTIPATVSSIQSGAFAGSTALTKVVVQADKVYDIADDAFPASVYENAVLSVPYQLGEDFAAASGWKKFKHTDSAIPEDVTKFVANTKEGVAVTYKILDRTARTLQVGDGSNKAIDKNTTGTVTIPEKIAGFTVVALGQSAFDFCEHLTAIHLPATIESLGKWALSYCSALTELEFLSETAPTLGSSSVFNSLPAVTVTVPHQGIDGYKAILPSKVSLRAKITLDHKVNVFCTSATLAVPEGVKAYMARRYDAGKQEVLCSRVNVIKGGVGVLLVTDTPGDYFTTSSSSNVAGENLLKGVLTKTTVAATDGTLSNLLFNGTNESAPCFDKKAGDVTAYTAYLQVPTADLSSATSVRVVCTEEDLSDSFVAQTVEGVDMSFTITSKSEKTVCVSAGDPEAADGSAVYRTTAGVLTIPETINGYRVTAIADNAFYGCSQLTEVVIPASVETVGKGAFYECNKMKWMVLMGCPVLEDAFKNCYPDFLIYSSTPPECKSIFVGGTRIYVPKGSSSAYQTANNWKYCIQFNEVYPMSTNSFMADSDEGVSITYDITDHLHLKVQVGDGTSAAIAAKTSGKLTIPAKAEAYDVTTIGTDAFTGCSKLTEVVIPASITKFENRAFAGCTALTNVVTQRSTTVVGFNNDVFPASVYESAVATVPYAVYESYRTSAGWKNFKHFDTQLPEADDKQFVAFTEERAIVTYTYLDKNAKTVQVGDGSNRAVDRYTSGSVTIPESINGYTVVALAENAFEFCSGITDIHLPSTITSLNTWSLYVTGTLRIYFQSPTPPTLIGYNIFSTTNKNVTAIVPQQSLDAYKAAFPSNINVISDVEATGVRAVVNSRRPTVYYDLNGRRTARPARGINIIRDADGRTRKVVGR